MNDWNKLRNYSIAHLKHEGEEGTTASDQVQHARANLTYNSEYHHTKSDLQQLVIYDSPFEDHTPDIAPY